MLVIVLILLFAAVYLFYTVKRKTCSNLVSDICHEIERLGMSKPISHVVMLMSSVKMIFNSFFFLRSK